MRKPRKNKNSSDAPPVKRETIEEFLARGGTVTKVAPAPIPEEDGGNRVTPTTAVSSTMMSLSEGALFYSESRAKPKERKKAEKPINLAFLPASLLKYTRNKE